MYCSICIWFQGIVVFGCYVIRDETSGGLRRLLRPKETDWDCSSDYANTSLSCKFKKKTMKTSYLQSLSFSVLLSLAIHMYIINLINKSILLSHSSLHKAGM